MNCIFRLLTWRRIAKFCSVFLCSVSMQVVANFDGTEVAKSPSDNRQYHSLTLDNDLRVMLVSDPEADEAAAAMDVYVGSGDDPDDREGIAHYLEHMLFLGTEKYPEAGEYQKFIQQHGGNNNAYTVLSNTNYYFSIDPNFLKPALDRFAQFFISPLFDEKYVQRERSVVDSEYKARVKDEGRRLWTARSAAYNPAHPSTGFSVGSVDSLADRQDDLVRDDLLVFYKQHYHTGKMVLVVVGKQPIKVLQKWVSQQFSQIRSVGKKRHSFSTPLFLPDSLPRKITLKPLKETRRVTFSFPVKSSRPHIRKKPLQYLSNLLGHEGEGSLLAELKQRAWASGLSAGRGYMDEVQGTFDISIELSPLGLTKIDEIGQMLFATINHLKSNGIKPLYFEEQKCLAALELKFQEEASPQDLAQSLASQLQRFAPQEVLVLPYLYEQFDPQLLKRYLAAFTPQNLLLTLVDPDFSSPLLTPWYDVEYALADISSAQLTVWQNPEKPVWLALPRANPFIPQDTELLAEELGQQEPQLMNTVEGLALWHQTLLEFKQPKAEFYFSLQSSKANASAREAVLTQLYVKAVNEALGTYSYPAYLAGLRYDMYRHSRGFSVRISGYADKQDQLLSRIIDAFSLDALTTKKFEQYKQQVQQSLENANKGRPSDVLVSSMYDIILSSSWSTEEKLAALGDINIDDLSLHATVLLKDYQITALSMGNVSREQSLALAQVIQAKLGKGLTSKPVARAQVRKLKPGEALFQEMLLPHPDSAAVVYYQGRNKSIKERAVTQLLSTLIRPDYYQSLRTENQVGYLVQAFAFNLLEVPAIAFSIQSNNHSVKDFVSLSDAFLNQYSHTLQQLPETEFKTAQAGLVSQLAQRDKTLDQVAGRYWSEIDRKAFNFDSVENMIEAVQLLTKAELIDFYQNQLLSEKHAEVVIVHYGENVEAAPERLTEKVLSGQSLQALRRHLNTAFAAY